MQAIIGARLAGLNSVKDRPERCLKWQLVLEFFTSKLANERHPGGKKGGGHAQCTTRRE